METIKILEILGYTLPAAVTGLVASYFFNSYFKDQQNTRRWLLQKEHRKDVLPLRLQAYERLSLFAERINPANLLVRIVPLDQDCAAYVNFVVAQIEQEYEHNLTQQIYVSAECWFLVGTAKNATIALLRTTAEQSKGITSDDFRTMVLQNLSQKPAASIAVLEFIKTEVKQLF